MLGFTKWGFGLWVTISIWVCFFLSFFVRPSMLLETLSSWVHLVFFEHMDGLGFLFEWLFQWVFLFLWCGFTNEISGEESFNVWVEFLGFGCERFAEKVIWVFLVVISKHYFLSLKIKIIEKLNFFFFVFNLDVDSGILIIILVAMLSSTLPPM